MRSSCVILQNSENSCAIPAVINVEQIPRVIKHLQLQFPKKLQVHNYFQDVGNLLSAAIKAKESFANRVPPQRDKDIFVLERETRERYRLLQSLEAQMNLQEYHPPRNTAPSLGRGCGGVSHVRYTPLESTSLRPHEVGSCGNLCSGAGDKGKGLRVRIYGAVPRPPVGI